MHINKNHIHRDVFKGGFSPNCNLLASTKDVLKFNGEQTVLILSAPFIALLQPRFRYYLMTLLYKPYTYRLALKFLEMKNAFQ